MGSDKYVVTDDQGKSSKRESAKDAPTEKSTFVVLSEIEWFDAGHALGLLNSMSRRVRVTPPAKPLERT